MQPISKYITLADASKSVTAKRLGISNHPDALAIENIRLLCKEIYDPLCDYFKTTIPVTSMFRSGVLNKKIGGSLFSQHMVGEAMDIDCDPLHNEKVSNEIVFFHIKNNLHFDQLIWEFGTNKRPDWIHVSYKLGRNRMQVLVASKDKNKKTVYSPF